MYNLKIRRALAVLTAAAVTMSGLPITVGAESLSEGFSSEEFVTEEQSAFGESNFISEDIGEGETDETGFGSEEMMTGETQDELLMGANEGNGDGSSIENAHDMQNSETEPWSVELTEDSQNIYMKYDFSQSISEAFNITVNGQYSYAYMTAFMQYSDGGTDEVFDIDFETTSYKVCPDRKASLYLKLYVESEDLGSLSISIKPASLMVESDDVTGTIGEPVTLSVKASSILGADKLTYQWKTCEYTDGAYIYHEISGATEASYTIAVLPEDETELNYCCFVSDGNETDIEEISVSISAGMQVATKEENTIDVWPGDTVSLKVDATSKKPITYTWFESGEKSGYQWSELECSGGNYVFPYSESMSELYKCEVTDGYDDYEIFFTIKRHEASEPHAVNIELAPNESHWFIKEKTSYIGLSGCWDENSDEPAVKVTYDDGKCEYITAENLEISSTAKKQNRRYIPGKYTRTVSYQGCSVTDDIYIVGFGENENGILLKDSLSGQTAGAAIDTYSFYCIKPEKDGYYDITFSNVSGSGKAMLYEYGSKPEGTLTLNGNGKISFEKGEYDDKYYLVVQGDERVNYDVAWGEMENEMPLDETVKVKRNPEAPYSDVVYTFTPKVSGFYGITAENVGYPTLFLQDGERIGIIDCNNARYLVKGKKYLFKVNIYNDVEGTYRLSLFEQEPSYEDSTYAGLIHYGPQISLYWILRGEKMEIICDGSMSSNRLFGILSEEAFGKVKSLVIDEGCTSISNYGFNYLKNLETVSLPASLTKIGIAAFDRLSKLETVILAENSKLMEVKPYAFDGTAFIDNCPGNYVMIGNLVLKYKGSEEETTIPENAERLLENSMKGSNTLKKISIQNKLSEIGPHSISSCDKLKDVEIPSNVTTIAYAAFASDTALENVVLNEGLESIEQDAFLDCPEIKEITIPKSVEGIGEHAIGYSNYSFDRTNYQWVISKYTKEELPTINCWYDTAGYYYARREDIPYKLLDEKVLTSDNPSLCNIGVNQRLKENGSYYINIDVHFAGELLTNGKDYTWTYSSIGNGKLKVTATGCGEYSGTCETIVNDIRVTKEPTPTPTTAPAVPTPTTAPAAPSPVPATPTPTTAPAAPTPTMAPATPTPAPTATPTPTPTPTPLKKGATFTVDTSKYKVTGTKTVAYTGTTNKKATKITIGSTVVYEGITYKITSIGSKALKNNAKVAKITVGNNVVSVGTSAFEGCKALKSVTLGTGVKTLNANVFKNCKKLSSITIKTTKLKTVKSNVFKGINAKAKIRVPSSKLKAYQKLLKKKGQGSKVKIKK